MISQIEYIFSDTKDRRSLTPLHYACQAGNSGIVKLLLESGSDVNSRGFAGTSPLHIAVSTTWSQTHNMATLFYLH